jgi:pyroglutamyl-peptidase
MSKTLLYSFAPFGHLKVNPAAQIAQGIQDHKEDCHVLLLPVTFQCQKELLSAFVTMKPNRIIGIGVAPGSMQVQIECYALNEIWARIPDNLGDQPYFKPILSEGPKAYRTTMDVDGILRDLQNQQIPSCPSFHAGMYVCNYSYYWTLHLCHMHNLQGLFIHVPLSPEEVVRQKINQPSFSSKDIVQALSKSLFR